MALDDRLARIEATKIDSKLARLEKAALDARKIGDNKRALKIRLEIFRLLKLKQSGTE